MAGQRIDDHSFWAGRGSEKSVLPAETKVKTYSDATDGGHLSKYEDTAEAIKAQQDEGTKKIKSHPLKPNYRN